MLATSPSEILADLCLLVRFVAVLELQICFIRLTKGITMKNAFAPTPIFTLGVASFLLLGKSVTANQEQDLISHRVFGQNLVDIGIFLIKYSLKSKINLKMNVPEFLILLISYDDF